VTGNPLGNPLENDPEREARIRARAYRLWEEDGRPHGRDVEFWERARALIGMEDSAGAGQIPNPAAPPPVRSGVRPEGGPVERPEGGPEGGAEEGRVQPRPAKAAAAKAPSRVKDAPGPEKAGKTTGPAARQGERQRTPESARKSTTRGSRKP
jgi:hypothetical protein